MHGKLLACAIAGLLTASPAFADRPSWAGGGNQHEEHGQRDNHGGGHWDREDRGGHRDRGDERRGDEWRGGERHGSDRRGGGDRGEHHFGNSQRVVVRDYYVHEYRGGDCPPGLAKKHNGCMPPGQARKWRRGYALPRDVAMYDLPPALVVQLGVPPAGYRYVRVASDILLIAVGTNMVIDAINDLGGM